MVDREIDVVDALAAVADFLLTGPPTGREPAMVQGNERSEPADRNSGGQRLLASSNEPRLASLAVPAAVVMLLITLWGYVF